MNAHIKAGLFVAVIGIICTALSIYVKELELLALIITLPVFILSLILPGGTMNGCDPMFTDYSTVGQFICEYNKLLLAVIMIFIWFILGYIGSKILKRKPKVQ